MAVTSKTGESFPYPKYPVGGFDVICTEESADARAYLNNMTFYYFNTTYTFPFAASN